MPSTLTTRTRELISSESDDFFQDQTVAYYINKSLEAVLSRLLVIEASSSKSLRSLDLFKDVATITPASSAVLKNTYYEIEIDLPATLRQIGAIFYNRQVVLRELTAKNLHRLEFGNAVPNSAEGYYYINDVSGTKKIRLFLHEKPDGTNDNVEVFFWKNPTLINLDGAFTETTFTEMPVWLEHAVLTGAAYMMLTQEGVKDPETSPNALLAQYNLELQNNVF